MKAGLHFKEKNLDWDKLWKHKKYMQFFIMLMNLMI